MCVYLLLDAYRLYFVVYVGFVPSLLCDCPIASVCDIAAICANFLGSF